MPKSIYGTSCSKMVILPFHLICCNFSLAVYCHVLCHLSLVQHHKKCRQNREPFIVWNIDCLVLYFFVSWGIQGYIFTKVNIFIFAKNEPILSLFAFSIEVYCHFPWYLWILFESILQLDFVVLFNE